MYFKVSGFIGITDVTFIAVDKRFGDDRALIRGDAAVDAFLGQLKIHGAVRQNHLRWAGHRCSFFG